MTPLRNDNETSTRTCPVCATAFVPVRRQRYDTPACRQAAWRARHTSAALTTAALPVTGDRYQRTRTVYACTECDQRYLGQQWCPDCTRPCVRVGLGGLCPCCDKPVTVDGPLDLPDNQLTAPSRENTAST